MWIERATLAESKLTQLDKVVDCAGFNSKLRQNSNQVLRRDNYFICKTNCRNRGSPARQMVFCFATVIIQ